MRCASICAFSTKLMTYYIFSFIHYFCHLASYHKHFPEMVNLIFNGCILSQNMYQNLLKPTIIAYIRLFPYYKNSMRNIVFFAYLFGCTTGFFRMDSISHTFKAFSHSLKIISKNDAPINPPQLYMDVSLLPTPSPSLDIFIFK